MASRSRRWKYKWLFFWLLLRARTIRSFSPSSSCLYVPHECLGLFTIHIWFHVFRLIQIINDRCVFCFRFRIDNTDHIIDVNKNNAAFEYDQVNIICPVYQPGTYDEDAEKYIIYNVSTRFVSNRNARNLALDTGRKIVTSPSVYPGPPP